MISCFEINKGDYKGVVIAISYTEFIIDNYS